MQHHSKIRGYHWDNYQILGFKPANKRKQWIKLRQWEYGDVFQSLKTGTLVNCTLNLPRQINASCSRVSKWAMTLGEADPRFLQHHLHVNVNDYRYRLHPAGNQTHLIAGGYCFFFCLFFPLSICKKNGFWDVMYQLPNSSARVQAGQRYSYKNSLIKFPGCSDRRCFW